jgi:hypothetical protein
MHVATKGKRKTTFAKLDREGKLRERRAIKQAKKDARKLGAGAPEASDPSGGEGVEDAEEPTETAAEQAATPDSPSSSA